MTGSLAATIGDVLAWAMALACAALVVINAYTIARDRHGLYTAASLTQAVAALYSGAAFAMAAVQHDRVGIIDGRLAVLVIVLASIADRIVHARSCR